MEENGDVKEVGDGSRRIVISTDGDKYIVEEREISIAELRDFCKITLETYGYKIVR